MLQFPRFLVSCIGIVHCLCNQYPAVLSHPNPVPMLQHCTLTFSTGTLTMPC